MDATQMRVLIVEDYEIGAKVLQLNLKKLGFPHIDLANNWETAIKRFITSNYHLIFMDVGLPDIHGFQLAKFFRILEQEKKQTSVIIAATGYAVDKDLIDEGHQSGINGIIQKPYYALDIEKALADAKIAHSKEEVKKQC